MLKKIISIVIVVVTSFMFHGNLFHLSAEELPSQKDSEIIEMKENDFTPSNNYTDLELDPMGIKKNVDLTESDKTQNSLSTLSSLDFIYSSQRGGDQTLNLYNPETLFQHSYIPRLGYLMEYLGVNNINNAYYDVRFQGGVYALHSSDIEKFIPLGEIKSFPYYINEKGKINHYIEGNPLVENSWYFHSELGNAPSWMQQGKKYYSFSGIYFTDNPEKLGAYDQKNQAVNSQEPYYDYYLYQPLRTKTTYSIDEINNAFNYFYSSSSVKGQPTILMNKGDAFKYAETLYGTNALMVLSLGIHEGAYGTSSISINKNNPFGYAAYDSNTEAAKAFDSVQQAINYVSGEYLSWVHADPTAQTGSNYYGANFGNKSSGINVKYASDPFWGEKNANIYAEIDRYLGGKDYEKYGLAIAAQGTSVYWEGNTSNKSFMYKNSTSLLTYMYPVVIHNNTNEWAEVSMEPPFDNENNIDWYGKYNWDKKGYINKNNLIVVNSPSTNSNIVTEGNYIFYLNDDQTIKWAEEKINGKTLSYYEYYSGAKYGVNHSTKIKYKFFMNDKDEVIKAEERNNGTRHITAYYEYYSGAKYGVNHGIKIKYKFFMNDKNELIKAEERKNESRQITTYYEYYSGAKYDVNHGIKIKYKFFVNDKSEVIKAEERKNESRQIVAYYEYYINAEYGVTHGIKIKYKFFMDDNSYISSAEGRENGSKKVNALYYYFPETKYGNHSKYIKEIIYL